MKTNTLNKHTVRKLDAADVVFNSSTAWDLRGDRPGRHHHAMYYMW